MTLLASIAVALLFAGQPDTPAAVSRLAALDEAAAVKAIAADPAAARGALDQLLAQVDASVHSDRQRPEQRRVTYDSEGLDLGVKVGSFYGSATGDRRYERRFEARKQRLAGTELLNGRKYRDALEPLQDALREAQALGDGWLETITRVNLAYGYLELGDGAQALAQCEQAAKVAEKLDDKARALTLFNLGSVHLHLGHAEKAIEYSLQAVAGSQRVGIRLWEGNSLMNIGAARRQLGDANGSRQAFEDALVVLEKTSDRLGLGRVLYNLGLVASGERRFAEAAAYMERALPIIRGLDIRHSHEIETDPERYQNPIELAALQVLIDAYTKLGQREKADAHRQALKQLQARPAHPSHPH